MEPTIQNYIWKKGTSIPNILSTSNNAIQETIEEYKKYSTNRGICARFESKNNQLIIRDLALGVNKTSDVKRLYIKRTLESFIESYLSLVNNKPKNKGALVTERKHEINLSVIHNFTKGLKSLAISFKIPEGADALKAAEVIFLAVNSINKLSYVEKIILTSSAPVLDLDSDFLKKSSTALHFGIKKSPINIKVPKNPLTGEFEFSTSFEQKVQMSSSEKFNKDIAIGLISTEKLR